MDFRKILKDVMKKTGHTPRTLSAAAGITDRSIQYYLRGERSPSLEMADKILRAAGVELTIGGVPDAKNQTGKKD